MRIYYGWYVLALTVLFNMITIGTTTYAYGLFVVPVSKSFDLSRAEINTGLILLSFGVALTAPFVGRALDRFSLRRIMLVSGPVFGACLVLLGLSRNIWLSAAIVAGPLAVALSGSGPFAANILVARWFSVYRGRAMAISGIGVTLGSVVMTPPLGLLIDAVGWRATLIIVGCAAGAILSSMTLLVRDRPGAQDREVETPLGSAQIAGDAAGRAVARPLSPGKVLLMAQFWLVALSSALALGIVQTVALTMVPLAQGFGISTARAAVLLSIYGAASISGKLLFAWIVDRMNRTATLVFLFALLGLASALFLAGDSFTSLAVCSAVFGLGSSAIMPGFFSVLADRFGSTSFGTVQGLAAPVLTITAAVCMRYAGEVFDRTGSYDCLFVTFAVVLAVAAAMMLSVWLLFRPVAPDNA